MSAPPRTIPPAVTSHALAGWHGLEIRMAATTSGVCALLPGPPATTMADLRRRFPGPLPEPGSHDATAADWFARALACLDDPALAPPPLAAHGTPFQRAVWHALLNIPRGKTIDYTMLAAAAGYPNATRAAATACGANPIAILIPCHRVIRRDGSLAGYRWGTALKQLLLARDAAHGGQTTPGVAERMLFSSMKIPES
jgi:AraC family transcriptional regulator of adaptative response/methylated-DNA-[protein]-cysteine methyltransferase